MAVIAYLRTGRPNAARNAINQLGPRTGRAPSNLRNRLLSSLVSEAERAAAAGVGGADQAEGSPEEIGVTLPRAAFLR